MPADGVTFLNCGPAEVVRIGLAAADDKNLEAFSPTIAHHRPSAGTDRRDRPAHRAGPARPGRPAVRQPGSEPIRLHWAGDGDPASAVYVRYRPAPPAKGPDPVSN